MVASGTANAAQLGRGAFTRGALGAVAALKVVLLLRSELSLHTVEMEGLRA